MVAKFQAVQAAHEILSNAETKTKYDTDRARLNKVNITFTPADIDPYNFRRPAGKPVPTASQFPPPPRRTQTTKDFGAGGNARFAPSNGRPNPATAASGADKFKPFTRATPQQWDRTKFDEAARADAANRFQAMKGTRAFPGAGAGQQMPPPPPPPTRPPRGPTAPKTNTQPFDPASPNLSNLSNEESLRPGFPGMSRTANLRRGGFDPSSPSPGMDEQQAPNRASAYSTYNRGDRPQASNSHGYFPESAAPQSPPMANRKPALSPLRHVRSESGWEPPRSQRPEVERVSSKYANTPGERTNLGGGFGRSASVRTSPVERHWDESEGRSNFGRPVSHHGAPRRHRSTSPKTKPADAPIELSSSSSDSSADERPTPTSRPKARIRRPKVQTSNSEQHGYRPFSEDDPALTGQFTNKNYTKLVDDNGPSPYNYPAPDDSPVRRPFSNMTSPEDAHPGMNGNHLRPDGGIPKYDTPPSFSQRMPGSARARKNSQSGVPRRHQPTHWQVPSSVMPGLGSLSKRFRLNSIPEERTSKIHGWLSEHPSLSDFEVYREPWKADNVCLSNQRRPPPEQMHSAQSASNLHSVSEENANSTFTAADWEGKFGSGDEFLRPSTDTSDRDRRSPTKTTRARARSTGKVKLDPQNHVQENVPPVPGPDSYSHQEAVNGTAEAQNGFAGDFQSADVLEQPKAAAFQPGKFSADEWAEKFKEQKWTTPSSELNSRRPKLQKKGSKLAPRTQIAPELGAGDGPEHNFDFEPPPIRTEDAMDIDGDSMENMTSKFKDNNDPIMKPSAGLPRTERNGGLSVNLEDLGQTAPFAPSATGLKDLDDLTTALPFPSRAAASVDPVLNRTISSTARRLDLPKPPKTVLPPAEDALTQGAWETYVYNINTYLHDWNVFNIKMLDHFRTRQDQINVGMRNNWISSIGDGPKVEVFDDAADSDGLRAGFATYMAWLEDDARCRSWWDTANERHRECFENISRIRERVKKAAGVV